MSFTVRSVVQISEGGVTIQQSTNHTCDQVNKLVESIPDATTDKEFQFAIDVSQLQVFSIVADQVLTIETNSGSSPQETIVLVANKPVVFETGDSALFAGDVTSLFITNASGSAAALKVISGSATA